MLHHSVCIGTFDDSFTKGDADIDNSFMLMKEASKKVDSNNTNNNSPRIKQIEHIGTKPNMTSSEVKNKGRLRLSATEANGMDSLMNYSSVSKHQSKFDGNLNEDLSKLAPKAAVVSPSHGPAKSAAAISPRSPRRSKGKKSPGQRSPQSPKAHKKANLQLPTADHSPLQHHHSKIGTSRNSDALSNRREMTRTKLDLLKTEKLQLLDEVSR